MSTGRRSEEHCRLTRLRQRRLADAKPTQPGGLERIVCSSPVLSHRGKRREHSPMFMKYPCCLRGGSKCSRMREVLWRSIIWLHDKSAAGSRVGSVACVVAQCVGLYAWHDEILSKKFFPIWLMPDGLKVINPTACDRINLMLIATPDTLREAEEYLMAHDPVLKQVIDKYRPCDITPHSNYYQELVESIVGQQLSVKAARAIRQKFVALFGGTFPSPERILQKQPEEFRAAGLSWAKAKYVRDIAEHVVGGKIRFDHLDQLSNEEVIKELTDIKGVGEWTAHMFLIFLMGRLDILPVGDLGIKNGIRQLYGFKDIPTIDQMLYVAKKNCWHPYESVASWYIWASLDNKPA